MWHEMTWFVVGSFKETGFTFYLLSAGLWTLVRRKEKGGQKQRCSGPSAEYWRSLRGLESGSIPASRRFPFWQKTPKLCPPSASNFTLETLVWTCSDRCWESLLFVESRWLLRWYIRKICSGKHFVLEIYSAQKLDVLFLLLCVYRQKMFCSQMCGNKSWIICQLSSQSSWMNNEQN